MRVALVTSSFPLDEGSSSGAFIARLAESLARQCELSVITPCANRPAPREDSEAAYRLQCFRYAPRRLQLLAHQPGGVPVALRHRRWLYALVPGFVASLTLACLRAAATSDVVHANWAFNGLFATAGAGRWRRPLVTTLRGSDVSRARSSRTDRAILTRCAHHSDALVTVSEALREEVGSLIPGARPKLRVIPNGVDPALLALARPAAFAEGGRLRLISVGSMIPRKGLDVVLRAMADEEAPADSELMLVGEGPERSRLEALARDLGLARRVIFAGHTAPAKIPDYLRGADVFVLASHSEGRANVILEALAAGVPVIASNIPGTRELIRDGITGRLFPDGDHRALARQLKELARSPDDGHARARAGRQWIVQQNLTWEACAEAYRALYAELLRH